MKRAFVVALVLAWLAVACTGSGGAPDQLPTSGATGAGSSTSSSPTLRFAAEIRAPRPSGDLDSWHQLLWQAADEVCTSLDSLRFRTRDITDTGAVIVTGCDGVTRYVHVVFNGVTVPHLSGNRLAVVRKRLGWIGLIVGHVTHRSHSPDAEVDRQDPKPGAIVPSGAAIDLVLAGSG